MNLKADPEKTFLLKFLLIGVVSLLVAMWFAYDGFIGYPAKLPRAAAWDELKADESLDDEQRLERWTEISQANGWKVKRLNKEEETKEVQRSIIWQYVCMVLGIAVGIPCILWYLANKNSWIACNDGVIESSWGQSFKPAQVQQFDKKKWEKKGIGIVTYVNDEGTEQRFRIDDLKYNRAITDEIVRWLEGEIGDEKIVNGPPESSLVADAPNEHEPEIPQVD